MTAEADVAAGRADILGFGLSVEPQLWALVFVMIRVGAAFVAAPVFGAVGVPLPVRVALSGAVGVLVLGDEVRPTSAAAVARLRALGLDVRLLTGDARSAAEAAAREVGIAVDAVDAEVLPADKLAVVRALQAAGARVAMVGFLSYAALTG